MGRKYKIRDQEAIHFVTFTIVNWIDLFIRDVYKEVILDSLKYCQVNKGLHVHAYCIMTSHIHLIVSVREGVGLLLSDVIRDFKSYTSFRLKNTIKESNEESRREWLLWMFERAGKRNKKNKDFQLWQQHNHPITLDTNKMINQRLEYIHNNPVAAGFVNDASTWLWSSCAAYEKEIDAPIHLVFIQ